jgi:hypothetical protein
VTVRRMGLHWIDVRSPELQAALGNPAGFQPFTKTYFLGSWDGRFIFGEPMITHAYLLALRNAAGDEIIPLPTAAHADPVGLYPTAYRIAYVPRSHEFLVGLTDLQPPGMRREPPVLIGLGHLRPSRLASRCTGEPCSGSSR